MPYLILLKLHKVHIITQNIHKESQFKKKKNLFFRWLSKVPAEKSQSPLPSKRNRFFLSVEPLIMAEP